MRIGPTVGVWMGLWTVAITAAHGFLNLDWAKRFRPDPASAAAGNHEKFRVGFLPVTCHLTCPVTDFINKQLAGENLFEPMRFNGWPELKEAFLAGRTPATFLLAPMAIALREQGVPIKVVYLGHRDGSAVMVHKDSDIRRMQDLRGKRIAVPNRYSNQRLLIFRALNDAGMRIEDVQLIEMPPPDMPAALFAKAVDAISSGEPFMAQTELDGYGRVLWLTKDVWPNFISCVLAVHEDMIRDHREVVQELVTGIAKSGKWLDQTMDHRMDAAQFVAKNYYNQHPRLLEFVLSKPPDRVKYTNLSLRRGDFEEIEKLGQQAGILKGTARFEDYTDCSFVPDESAIPPHAWPGLKK
ncbi:MAG: ABC transporter substrate-binding protein [Planctomycetes bacterium]|nr:ABC transporter substrate-binding protein [Planctomycetota bacterium]